MWRGGKNIKIELQFIRFSPPLQSHMQLLTDTKEILTVNHTVFYCHTLRLCTAVESFLTSPYAQTDQAQEWREFFQPALQENLLPFFFKETSAEDQHLFGIHNFSHP